MVRLTDLEPAEDLSEASWVLAGLHPFGTDVGSIVPSTFAAYARVFHPAARLDGDAGVRSVAWREIASAHGRVAHGLMQLENLVGVPWPAVDSWKEPGLVDQLPDQGSLPPDAAHQLARILGRHTATASSCWFAIWEGFGDLGALRDLVAARLPVPQRGMVVLRGRLEDADQLVTDCGRFQSANLWWPDDRSWCVATEIDLRSTYVGGSPSAIQAVIDDPSLEAFAADASDRIDVWSDTRNPAPADG